MRLDDDGTRGGEGGDRISSHRGESQREVARLEHRHYSQRNIQAHQADSLEDRVFDAIPMLAGPEKAGEGADLSYRPGQLAIEALPTQT